MARHVLPLALLCARRRLHACRTASCAIQLLPVCRRGGLTKAHAGVQTAAKEAEKVAAFFSTYSDASSDYINPEGSAAERTRRARAAMLQPCCCV